MDYRITKECGDEWDKWLEEFPRAAADAWGVSKSQRLRAEKVTPGDIFLHYIDGAHAWAGYSTVDGPLRKNDLESDADWLVALPFVIPIKVGVRLKTGQCEGTVRVSGLSDKHYHRQVAFTKIARDEGDLIKGAIDKADHVQSAASPKFLKLWNTSGPENYYKGIVKGDAGGKCCLCGEDAVSWATRWKIEISKEELESIRGVLLDGAHLIPNRKSGRMDPKNLRALCANCHRVFDRLSKDSREKLEKLLGKIRSS